MVKKLDYGKPIMKMVNQRIIWNINESHQVAQTKILIYKNEFVLNLKYKIKVFSRGFYLNGLNSLE